MDEVGRPSLYDPDVHPQQAESLAMLGKTNTEIAEELKISTATLYNWQKEHPEFLEALKIGKESPNDNVEASLYKRANGYRFIEIKVVALPDGTERKEKTVKEIPPDPTSCIFWLKNRRPRQWRDRVQQEISGLNGGPIEVMRMTDDELEQRAKQILSRRTGNTD